MPAPNYITSITDRPAYVALGRSNTTPGASSDETYAWAGEATLARVWDAATEAERSLTVVWIRCGERDAVEAAR